MSKKNKGSFKIEGSKIKGKDTSKRRIPLPSKVSRPMTSRNKRRSNVDEEIEYWENYLEEDNDSDAKFSRRAKKAFNDDWG